MLVILEVQDFGPDKLILSDDPQTVDQLTPIFRGAHIATKTQVASRNYEAGSLFVEINHHGN